MLKKQQPGGAYVNQHNRNTTNTNGVLIQGSVGGGSKRAKRKDNSSDEGTDLDIFEYPYT